MALNVQIMLNCVFVIIIRTFTLDILGGGQFLRNKVCIELNWRCFIYKSTELIIAAVWLVYLLLIYNVVLEWRPWFFKKQNPTFVYTFDEKSFLTKNKHEMNFIPNKHEL